MKPETQKIILKCLIALLFAWASHALGEVTHGLWFFGWLGGILCVSILQTI